jgi:hypothetical protein
MAWMASSVPCPGADDDLEEPTVGVETEAEFACWLVVIDGVGDQVLLGGVPDVVVVDPCFRADRWTSTQQTYYETVYSGRRRRCFGWAWGQVPEAI